MSKTEDSARRFAQLEGERDYYKRIAEKREVERDELRKLAYIGEHMHYDCSWKARFAEMKNERDALAAWMERIKEASSKTRVGPRFSVADYIAELQCTIESPPEISLARRDKIKQAEAFELAERYAQCEQDAAMLRLNAVNLRRQAEARQ